MPCGSERGEYHVSESLWPVARCNGGWDYIRGWLDNCRPLWTPRLTLGERRSRSDVEQRVAGAWVGLDGGEDVIIYASYLPHIGRCAHNEQVEKRPMRGEHMSHGNVLAREEISWG